MSTITERDTFRPFQMNSFRFVDGLIKPDDEMLGLAVELQARMLDECAQGWEERITEELDMHSCEDCVLGQVFGTFGRGMEYLGQCGESTMPFVFTHPMAAQHWEAEIARRRG